MGRRALRKIKPEIDLTGRLLSYDDLPNPWDAEALFSEEPQRGRPLEVEVGSGKGLFLRRATAERPEHNFLGVEIAHKYARYCAAELVKQDADNGKVLSGDGLRLFHELLPDGALEAVHVYFPDPWWKKRHAHRRVLNDRFLLDVARTLRDGGRLHFWTDVEDYYQATLELIATMRGEGLPLTGPHPVEERPFEHHLDFHTHFERRTRLNDEPVFRAEFERIARTGGGDGA
ncbi:tRNA (guanine-N(7)-)-methyltransferase [Pseudobythopirellula maris]|uniref:tRNA (guanine-N(7)-)-methyltransferase n=1 Tax=Pseudobythopirellula maris TaxID=2527991 RepID=A0A5C5ZK59_9BACT|nr:tRNA (guanosine(46)-N7)-methyltransferase TrmB [Pseudobythopirellula maris]TWT87437.1 tRNA (guanine-N(7)-)-methyltransferase [Pseudobythopirellula maris]